MTWFKIDDNFADHPKFVARTDTAIATWLRALAYSSRYLTDGEIPKDAQKVIGPTKAINELVKAGLLIDCGDHWKIHDYTDHQRTKAEVQADRDAATERSRRYRERQRDGARHASRADLETETEKNHHLHAVTPLPTGDDELISQAIDIVTNRRCQGKNLSNPDAYRAKVRRTIETELRPRAVDLLTRYQPPPDVLAAALEGETQSIGRYRIATEGTA